MSIYITFCGCYTTNVLRLFFGIQFLLASVGDFRGGSRDSVDRGGAQLWSNIFNN
jgi:hypothetical protein